MKIIPARPDWGATLAAGFCGFITRRHDLVGDGIEYFERFENGLPFVHTFIVEGKGESSSSSSSNPSTVSIIEAHASTGVARATLDEYLGQGESSSSFPSQNSADATPSPNHDATRPIAVPSPGGVGQGEGELNSSSSSSSSSNGGLLADGPGASHGGSTARCQCFVRIPVGWTPETGQAIVAAAASHLGERYAFPLILADALANTFLGHCLNRLAFNLPDRFVCWALANARQKICSQLVALALQSQPALKLRGCLRRPAATILPRELGNDPAIWEPEIYELLTLSETR